MNAIIEKMQVLQQIFKDAKSYAEQEEDIEKIANHLKRFDGEFISIAYEATAMALALKGFEQWQLFLNTYGKNHAVQVHVGLGWALAQDRKDPSYFMTKIDPFLGPRVFDGYGYYDGFFRRRKVLQGNFPSNLSDKEKSVYLQGVGRSLWYISKGDLLQLNKLINQLVLQNHKDIWRGIGIAVTYVGGMNLELWNSLINFSANSRNQLASGVAMAIKSRFDASTLTKDTALSCSVFGEEGIESLVQLMDFPLQSSERDYFSWVSDLDLMFSKI